MLKLMWMIKEIQKKCNNIIVNINIKEVIQKGLLIGWSDLDKAHSRRKSRNILESYYKSIQNNQYKSLSMF